MKSIKIFLFIAALTFTTSSFAQQKGTSFIGVSGGVSIPLGNWGKTATASSLMSINGTVGDVHGWASPGGFGSVDGGWFFSKHFAIGVMFKYGTHSLKGVDSLSQGYEESFDVDTTRTTHTNYKIWSIMPGLYYHLKMADKLSFTARVLVGLAHASTPQILVTIEDGGVFDAPAIQYSSSQTSFAWDIGAGLRYALTKHFALDLKADYFYTKSDFKINNSVRVNNAGR
jgi:opacity protein-like surface antigen